LGPQKRLFPPARLSSFFGYRRPLVSGKFFRPRLTTFQTALSVGLCAGIAASLLFLTCRQPHDVDGIAGHISGALGACGGLRHGR